jgi:hypothetical protein
MSDEKHLLVEGQIKSSFNSAKIRQQVKAWTSTMKAKLSGHPLPGDVRTELRIDAGEKVRQSGGPNTERYLKVFEKAIRAESYSAGSRETLAQLYRGCPDEAMIMFISQLLTRQAKLSPTEVAARDKAIGHAHTWATKAGHDFAIGMEPISLD